MAMEVLACFALCECVFPLPELNDLELPRRFRAGASSRRYLSTATSVFQLIANGSLVKGEIESVQECASTCRW